MSYKRILTVQDISCIGQCSVTVALPIMSACGHEVCILPAAVLSTHTGGFGKPAVVKLGGFMESAVSHWKENGITFDLVYVGYLGSLEAVEIAQQVMDTMVAPGGITVVDPALADHGKRYSGLSEEYAQAMFRLCRKADVVVPNVTEASMMAEIPYREQLDEEDVRNLLERIPGKNVLLTGVGFAGRKRASVCGQGRRSCIIRIRSFPGIIPEPVISLRPLSAERWHPGRRWRMRDELRRILHSGALKRRLLILPIGTA